MPKLKTKKVVVVEGTLDSSERCVWTAEVVPGESIRIFGSYLKHRGREVFGVQFSTYTVVGRTRWIHTPHGVEVAARYERLSSDVRRLLGNLLLGLRKREVPLGIARDAFEEHLEVTLTPDVLDCLGFEHGEDVYDEIAFDRTFEVGFEAISGGFNIDYIDTIQSIGKKTVTLSRFGDRTTRMKIAQFVRENYRKTVSEARKSNSEWMD